MAKLLTREFASKYGVKQGTFRQHKSRGMVVTQGRYVDENHPVNKIYIAKRLSIIGQPIDVSQEIAENKTKGVPTDLSKIPLNKLKMEQLKEQKLREEIDKLVIGNQKMRGELVPIEMIKPLFIQYSKSMVTAFQNATENVLVEFGHRKNLTLKEKSEIKKEIVNIINQAVDVGAEDTKRSIKSIVDDYSKTRSIGQHG